MEVLQVLFILLSIVVNIYSRNYISSVSCPYVVVKGSCLIAVLCHSFSFYFIIMFRSVNLHKVRSTESKK